MPTTIHNRLRRDVRRLRAQIEALQPAPPATTPSDWVAAQQRARAIRPLFHEVDLLVRAYPHAEEVHALHALAIERVRQAAGESYPEAFWPAFAAFRRGDPSGLEQGLDFLEADPWFFRSGYVKEWLIRAIVKLPVLTPEVEERLRRVVLAAVDGPDRREFRRYCRLARKVDTPELRAALEERLTHPEERVRRHARWVLEALGRTQSPRAATLEREGGQVGDREGAG